MIELNPLHLLQNMCRSNSCATACKTCPMRISDSICAISGFPDSWRLDWVDEKIAEMREETECDT